MGFTDKYLGHGAPTGQFHHLHSLLRMGIHANFFDVRDTLGQQKALGLNAIGAHSCGVHLDGLHVFSLYAEFIGLLSGLFNRQIG